MMMSNGPIIFRKMGMICDSVLYASFPKSQITIPRTENTTIFPNTNNNTCNQGTLSTNDLLPYIVIALTLLVSWQGATAPTTPSKKANKNGNCSKPFVISIIAPINVLLIWLKRSYNIKIQLTIYIFFYLTLLSTKICSHVSE